MGRLLLLLLALFPSHAVASQPLIGSYAFVQEDGTLRIEGRSISLAHVYIPPTDDTCYSFLRPIRCGPRAVLALELKVGGDFVDCEVVGEPQPSPGATIPAQCGVEGEDLGAWMLQQGWAVALPNAPPEYHALERIARAQGRGVWGLPLAPLNQP